MMIEGSEVMKVYQTAVRTAVIGVGLYGLLVGVTTLVAGYVGMDGKAFDQAVALAETVGIPAPTLWGVAAILAGALALVPSKKVSQCGLYCMAVWTLFFGATLLLSAPPAGYRGVCTYLFVTCMITGLILLRRLDPRL